MTLSVNETPRVVSHQVGDRLEPGFVEHSRQHPAVDLDGGPVDVVGLAAGQVHAGAADFGTSACALERNLREVLAAVLVVRRQYEALEVFGHGGAQGQTVDPDLRAPLLRE